MRCPRDNTDLIEIERQGIEIDYCPTCRGVWLDRSELDEVIARSAAPVAQSGTETPGRDVRDDRRDRPVRDDRDYRGEPSRRPGGILGRVGELLDDDRDRSRRRDDRYDDDDDDRYDDRDRHGRSRRRRKRGVLDDLFDF